MSTGTDTNTSAAASDPRPDDPKPDDPKPDDLEGVVTALLGAASSLEYGAVKLTVQAGRVVQLERTEKKRLSNQTPSPAAAARR